MKQLPILILWLVLGTTAVAQPYYGVKHISSGWGIGLATGLMQVAGDIPADGQGYAGNIFIQRTLSRVMDARLDLGGGVAYGLSTAPTQGFAFNSALNGEYYPTFAYPDGSIVYPNFKMNELHASMMLKFNINRVLLRNGADSWDFYLMGGLGAFFYSTRTNLYDASTRTIYDYSQIAPGNATEVRKALQRLLDNTYDVVAQNEGNVNLFGMQANPAIPVGAGVYYRVSATFGIGVEAQITFMEDDLLDGQRWNGNNEPSPNKDMAGRALILMGYHF